MEEEAREYLRQKNILRGGCTTWQVTFENGRKIDIGKLMSDFAQQQVEKARKEWQNSIDRAHLTRDGDQEQKRKREKQKRN